MAVAADQRTGWHWRVAVGGFFVMIGGSVPLSGMSFFHPYVMQDLFPDNAAGFLVYYTVMILGIVLSMMFIGRNLLARLGPKPLMYIGTVVVALALVGFSVCQTAVHFYLAGAVLGIGYGISFQLVPILWVNTWFVEKKGTALGVVMGGTGLGGALWAFLVPMLSAGPGWRVAYLVVALVVLLFPLPATALLIRNTPQELGLLPLGAGVKTDLVAEALDGPVGQPGFTYTEALRNPWLLLIFGSVIVLGIVHGGAQILTVYLQGNVIYSPADLARPLAERDPADTAFFSAIMMTWTLGLLVFKPLLGWLNDRIGILGAMLVTLGMQSFAFFWLTRMEYQTLVPLMFVAMIGMAAGMSNGTVQPPLLFANAAGSRDFARIWSFFGTGYLIGMAVGAPVWGAVNDVFKTPQAPVSGYEVGFLISPVLLIGLTFTAVLGMKRGMVTYTRRYREAHPEPATAADRPAGPEPTGVR